MAKRKSVIEKVVDAVDHALHPVQPESAAPKIEAAPKVEESSSIESDIAKHPKFDKFKSIQGAE